MKLLYKIIFFTICMSVSGSIFCADGKYAGEVRAEGQPERLPYAKSREALLPALLHVKDGKGKPTSLGVYNNQGAHRAAALSYLLVEANQYCMTNPSTYRGRGSDLAKSCYYCSTIIPGKAFSTCVNPNDPDDWIQSLRDYRQLMRRDLLAHEFGVVAKSNNTMEIVFDPMNEERIKNMKPQQVELIRRMHIDPKYRLTHYDVKIFKSLDPAMQSSLKINYEIGTKDFFKAFFHRPKAQREEYAAFPSVKEKRKKWIQGFAAGLAVAGVGAFVASRIISARSKK